MPKPISRLPPLLGLWLALAAVFGAVAAQVTDWFDMTDELRYEQLALSIARSGSPLPRIHDIPIDSIAQLYPLLIAPFFGHGPVADDLVQAHVWNAVVMSSACIPAFLLARRVTGRLWAAYVVAALSVCVPWIVYSSMLMTEVAAYPAFVWAAYALQRAIAAPSWRNDLFALLTIAIAYFSRTALLSLVVFLPLAILVCELGRDRSVRSLTAALRGHALLAAVYAVLVPAALVLWATGKIDAVLGIYSHYTGQNRVLTHGFAGSFAEHFATFGLGLGLVPLLVGGAWLLANLVRPPAAREARAFAALGAIVLVAIPFQVTNFDLAYGLFVHDRFLVYLVPLLLVAVFCALFDARRPRWSLLLPAAVVSAGFAWGALPEPTWLKPETLNPDTPASAFYLPLVRTWGSLDTVRIVLVVVTLAVAALFVVAGRLRREHLTLGVTALMLVALPGLTAYAFHRMFSVDGWSFRPVTTDAGRTFGFIDQLVGTKPDVTIVPYPVTADDLSNQQRWRDVEFWNKSVVHDADYLGTDGFEYTGFWFPKLYLSFDAATGASSASPTRYAVMSIKDTRFRIAGTVRVVSQEVMLVDAGRHWRFDWLSSGLHDAGWLKPGEPMRVRVFPVPGQQAPAVRQLSIEINPPLRASQRHVDVVTNLAESHLDLPATGMRIAVRLCVPARGDAEVDLQVRDAPELPPAPGSETAFGIPRQGVLIATMALADELLGGCSV